MKLMRYNDVFPKFFDEFFTKENDLWNEKTLPAVNIKETEGDFQIEVAAPGLSKKDFNINLDQDTLTISSKKEDKKEDNVKGYSYRQFNYQSFERSFKLPEGKVNTEDIKAKYENGVLYLSLPKIEEAKPVKKKITIS